MKIIAFIVFLLTGLHSFSQTDSCKLQISLITCGPGEELYSIFGHSAIRVKNLSAGQDIIFNYGTFDFDDPDFYTKFVKGKLLYFVSTNTFDNFLYEYQYEGRSVIEQILNLTCEQKEKLFNDLRVNAREENKYYNYDFVYDNCSTRLRDILKSNNASFNDFLEGRDPSFRDMIHECLDKGNQPWSKFGIDLILGSPLDKKAGYFHSMFLPDYLMNGFDKATINNNKLVKQTRNVLPAKIKEQENSFFTPNILLFSLFIVVLVLSLIKSHPIQTFLNIFDVSYFLTLGILGFFILFMWFGTDHQLAANNYNLLWALPTNLPLAFVILRNKPWVKKYLLITSMVYIAVVLLWAVIPQGMNLAFLPLAMTAGIRSYFRSTKK